MKYWVGEFVVEGPANTEEAYLMMVDYLEQRGLNKVSDSPNPGVCYESSNPEARFVLHFDPKTTSVRARTLDEQLLDDFVSEFSIIGVEPGLRWCQPKKQAEM